MSEAGPSTWVVGIGGIGATLGCRLARDGDVLLVDGWEENIAAIQDRGLAVEYADETVIARAPAVTLDRLAGARGPAPHVVILAVKSYQTAETIGILKPLIGSETQVVSAQNGLNEDTIADLIGTERTVGAICLFDGQLMEPGRARQRRTDGKMVIGDLSAAPEQKRQVLQDIARRLRPAVDVEISGNIYGELWTKVIRNGMINGVCALAGADVGTAAGDDDMLSIIVALGVEGVRVARALGVTLIEADLYGASVTDFERGLNDPASYERVAAKVRAEYLSFARVIPSMAQDVAKGRPTEIEYLNGVVVAKGEMLGLETKVSAALVEAVKRIEGTEHRSADGSSAIEALAALVARLRNGG
ncbi:ketopantoate reductase family protein [Mycobacterium sp. E2479]|uniref:ketopantoate reductase family protein n=1 Tax=Mycobacterium sp. E2479 TaxID=1834134 RepID=UPI0018D29D2A|nr:2-dehydropantoate 2-reductase [Mycobacterium sp. E2479]